MFKERKVLKNKKKLNLKDAEVFIDSGLTIIEQIAQKLLREKALVERETRVGTLRKISTRCGLMG